MYIKVIRDIYTDTTTGGMMYLNGEFFCYTLEDVVRARGVKIKHETAIQAGIYDVVVTMSGRFKRMMPLLKEVPMFSGIRIHGGNTHKNSSGCILVAKNRINDEKIQGSEEKRLTKYLLQDKESVIEIIDTKKQG
jgi:hypothetical protein